MPRKKTLEQFIKEAEVVHGAGTYDYSKTVYVNNNTQVEIICPIHGSYFQLPRNHISAKCGCPKCGSITQGKNNRRNIYGIGINDIEDLCIDDKGKQIESYKTWFNMIRRCYDSKKKEQVKGVYDSCSVCKEWLLFSNFKKWFDNPENGHQEDYQLDKDILVKGNKIYSPETCCFVPREINTIFTKADKIRGNLYIGVGTYKDKYTARLSRYGKDVWLGYFNTEYDAFIAYKKAKENYIKEVAKSYHETGRISSKVYVAMINYTVEETD